MLLRADGCQVEREQPATREPLGLRVGEQNRDIRGGRMNGRPRIARVDLHVNFGMCRTETRESRNEKLACEKRWQEYPQGLSATAPCDLGQAAIEGFQQRLDLIQERVSGRRQLERPRFAFKQPDAE